ncbi:MAG: N-acetyl sugar amidotransferase [Fuerstiella sp.]|nr:N-acetyl sugar amidotransferase [Fuerstiella sp.]MCP4510350.1 N-acetyl sugar amidotransferase [Fuerstiella sp.]
MKRKYQQCSIGLVDTNDDPQIRFDEQGRSHYYHDYIAAQNVKVGSPEQRAERLSQLVADVKTAGKGRQYDCVIGVSGGVDSTYVALLAKELGLRPLAVHLDNGWNSELAVQNITNIVNRLDIDLFTNVLDWEQFRDLQLAYLKASVIDIEVISDHAIFATMHRVAGQRGIPYILSGTNCVTEQTLPLHWIHSKSDHVNIIDIHRNFGTRPLGDYPLMNWKVKKWYKVSPGLRYESILNLVPFEKAAVKDRIIDELDWRDYGGKHYESIFTRFYQGHILPTKFGVDKRKAHLSDLIYGGQISKKEALAELEKPIYDPEQMRIDREFVLKKLGLSDSEFDDIMNLPVRRHDDFEIERPLLESYPLLKPLTRPIGVARSLLWGRAG